MVNYSSAPLTLERLKEIQAVGIAFNLINIRVAELRKKQEASRISYNGNAAVATPGFPIKFAAISGPLCKHNSASSSSLGPEEKSRPVVVDGHLFV